MSGGAAAESSGPAKKIMTLRAKTLFITAFTLLGLIALLTTFVSTIFTGSSRQAEAQSTRQAVRGVRGVVFATVEQFNQKFNDWSSWDDAYSFVQNGNQEFIESNLVDESLQILNVNLMILLDSSGHIVFGTGFDPTRGVKTPIPAALKKHLIVTDPLLRHKGINDSVAGFIMLPSGPMMIAARPIVTSENKGPIRGTLIVGRNLNRNEIKRLSQIARLPLTILPLGGAPLPPDFQKARAT